MVVSRRSAGARRRHLPESQQELLLPHQENRFIAASTHSAASASGPSAASEFPAARGQYVAIYDERCEICQTFVSWLRLLDRHRKVAPVPILAELLPAIHPSLELDTCLHALHVVTPSRTVHRGWAAVAALARLFPETFLIGWLGRIPPFRWIGEAAYRFVARNRHAISKCCAPMSRG
jgi:predicted DCC family thiol-disulfide oxidoreductase YuxK